MFRHQGATKYFRHCSRLVPEIFVIISAWNMVRPMKHSCWETPWLWHLGAETCRSWHPIWSVFCDPFYCSLTTAFCWFLKIRNVRKCTVWQTWNFCSSGIYWIMIIIIITIFPYGLGLLTCSGIDALPSFLRSSTISSSSRSVVDDMFRQSGVVRSFRMVDPVFFVFGSYVLYSRDLSYRLASNFV